MPRSLISLGANLGNVRETMLAAGRMLRETFPEAEFQFSSLYRTPPVGGPSGQDDFLNAVVAIRSSHNVWEVWDGIKRVETELGRQRQHRWEARRIDIDVLLHDDVRIWTPHFKVPHPRMCMRAFILRPAKEIAGDWRDPVSQLTINELERHLNQTTRTLVVTPSEALRVQLQSALPSGFSAEWNGLIHDTNRKLTIVAVSTPDPETVQWEDYARLWTTTLGLHSVDSSFAGPRYLLPANDIRWAAHEIEAAIQAMDCSVEVVCPFEETRVPNSDR
jgi:2-amino-4-hydroxy-6-hydroxymethyldihydropteridine diphosphokinase